MSKWSPTGQLVRYMEHLAAKGGGHGKLAGELKNMMRAATEDRLLFTFAKMPKAESSPAVMKLLNRKLRRGDVGSNFPMSETLSDYPGVSKGQMGHVQRLLREKTDDLANHGHWTDAGQPSKYEMIDWRNTIDDAFNDKFQAGHFQSAPGQPLDPETSNLFDTSQKQVNMLDWMKRRGLFK